MKKQLKRTLSVLLCALLCCSTFALSVDAKTAKKYVKSIKVAKKATVTIPADKKTAAKKFKVTVKVSGKASKTFKAKSSKKSVAAVKVSGSKIKVTAKKAGKAIITVTTKAKNAKGKKLSKKLTLTVKKAKTEKSYVKAIGIESEDTIDIPAENETFTKPYKVIISAVGGASEKFTAQSSDDSVAEVKVDGSYVNVTAKKAGAVTITVTANGKDAKGNVVSAKLALTVTKATAPVNRDGEITEKKVKWYQYDGGKIIDEENPVYFSSEYPDVPFVKDSFAVDNFLKSFAYTTGADETKGEEGLSHTYKLPMGTSVKFDYDNQVLIFSDYTSTLVLNGDFMIYNPFSVGAAKTGLIYRQSDNDRYYGGDPVYATFAYDEVPMLKDGDDILIPLQTYSDLFISFTGQFYNYNGKDVFMVNNSLEQMAAADEGWKAYYDLYNDSVKTDKISEALAQVNYYELCNVLDARYGLQAAHNIASFDEYFTRMGFRERMLTTDLAEIEKAQQDISTALFEDFHSGSGLQSVYLSEPIEYTPQFSPGYYNRNMKMKNRIDARTKVLGTLGEDFSGYERVGDTVFITFDDFAMEQTMTSYVSEGYEPKANHNDTIELFAYALKQLQTKDKDAKNVVIDLACNGGGAIYSCAYAMQAICGQSQINIHNPNTWALHQIRTEWDLNFDGKYDENDKSMLDMGFNVAVNISDNSFSCGNLLPNELDELDDRILLIGQQSGGGACAVGFISTAISSTMQISSELRFSTMKNGYIKDIDGGIAPDVYLTDKKIFDREYIDKLVSEQFGVKDDTKNQDPVLTYCSKSAIDHLGYDNMAMIYNLISDDILPQVVSQLTTAFPTFIETDGGKAIGERIGLVIYTSEFPDSVASSRESLAYVSGFPIGTEKYICMLGVNVLTLFEKDPKTGTYTFKESERANLENTVIHEMMHAFMNDYVRAGNTTDKTNNYPGWFCEGIASTVENVYTFRYDQYSKIYGYSIENGKSAEVSTDDLLKFYKEYSEVYPVGDGPTHVPDIGTSDDDGNRISAYTMGYLATLYLSYLAQADNPTDYSSFSAGEFRNGLNKIFSLLHSGHTLDEVISSISGGMYKNTDDFTAKFVKGENGDGTNGKGESVTAEVSLGFCVSYLNYLGKVTTQLQKTDSNATANGSILLPLDTAEKSPIKAQAPEGAKENQQYFNIYRDPSIEEDDQPYVYSTVDPAIAYQSGGKTHTIPLN